MKTVSNNIKDQVCQHCIFSKIDGGFGVECVIDASRNHFQGNCNHFTSDLQNRPDLLHYRIQRLEREFEKNINDAASKLPFSQLMGNSIILFFSMLSLLGGGIILAQSYQTNVDTNFFFILSAIVLLSFGLMGTFISGKSISKALLIHKKHNTYRNDLIKAKELVIKNLSQERKDWEEIY